MKYGDAKGIAEFVPLQRSEYQSGVFKTPEKAAHDLPQNPRCDFNANANVFAGRIDRLRIGWTFSCRVLEIKMDF
ncbi:MAG: hypothetical protein NTW21_39885 [Verrucomicrobia bacterium]|nr:hypothetical protein [Verrucomicrobiota bacterium]